ncbi:hypothetical protein BHM03_00012679 [Ensete ventricosum]|nr:hypothetical protein BHM03_00012679 [Ensete ventricosum]
MRSPVCAGSPSWSGNVVAPLHSSSSFLGRSVVSPTKDLGRAVWTQLSPSDDQASWSYVGHVLATVLDKSSIAHCQGHCSLVGCCVCPNTSPVASCQGSGGTVRQLAVASALTRRLSPGDMGQGHWSRTGLARQLYCIVCCQRGQLAGHRIAIGYPEIGSGVRRRPDVTES